MDIPPTLSPIIGWVISVSAVTAMCVVGTLRIAEWGLTRCYGVGTQLAPELHSIGANSRSVNELPPYNPDASAPILRDVHLLV
jgi:hypothetical protein